MSAIAEVELISAYQNHTVTLRPPTQKYDEQGNPRITDRGLRVKFSNGRARVSGEEWALMQDAPAFTGAGERRTVFTADEMLSDGSGVTQVVHGALGATVHQVRPAPSDDWDEAGAVALAQRVSQGEFPDVEACLAYELAHKRRKTVVRALTEAMLDGPAPADDKQADPPRVVLPPDVEGV